MNSTQLFAGQSQISSTEYHRQSYSVAIVDDERLMTELLSKSLRRLGHRVIATADNGKDAVEIAIRLNPDLMLLDINMPGMDGVEAAREIARACDVPIILITGNADDLTFAKIRGIKIGAYLVKPFSPAQLNAAVHLVVSQRDAAQNG
jgi:two-component system, response regulator PdtaR